MPLHVVVTAKQVLDPEAPSATFKIDPQAKRVVPPPNIPPVVNNFDERAVEAALRLRDALKDVKITVVSYGKSFSLDAMRKPLAMGADELVLVQDDSFDDAGDSYRPAYVLAQAIRKLGAFDLVLSGRQASDWDNAQVAQGIAELLSIPCITLARKVEVRDGTLAVERVLSEGFERVEARLPALVTVSNELGEPRYPTLRGIMAASRRQPTTWTLRDIGLDPSQLQRRTLLEDLFQPVREGRCEFIPGEDGAERGRKLADRLRETKLI